MKFPNDLTVIGDMTYRGTCPKETVEHVTFINRMRQQHPEQAALLIHPQNEGKRHYRQAANAKAMGALNAGASDIIIPGAPAFVCEIKRRDHTQSRWQPGQQEYLRAAQEQGCFVIVALGADAAMTGVELWINRKK